MSTAVTWIGEAASGREAPGFSPHATGLANQAALQRAVDGGGTVAVMQPGTYRLAGTVYVGSDTTLVFGAGVVIAKVDEAGPFSHVLLNKGARTRQPDHRIAVHGLRIAVNGMDVRTFADVFGLHGQIAFSHVRDLRITGFRCDDLGSAQYGIHVCSFEDLLIDDVIIRGNKDGVHLGRGKRFAIRNGVFQTFDDAIALNGHDYDVGNPELGWIEDGIVESCHDLNQERTTGYFARILAGGWCDWHAGMTVRKSDTVASHGRLYRVRADPDGQVFTSHTPPIHATGGQVIDGIRWEVVQEYVTYTAGVRNVVFRDIFLHKPRVGFSIHFDNDRYSRSYYPGAAVPVQQNVRLEGVQVLHDGDTPLVSANTPLDVLTIRDCRVGRGGLHFGDNGALGDHAPTHVRMTGCTFAAAEPMTLVCNKVPGKRVTLRVADSAVLHAGFAAKVEGEVDAEGDLPGIK